MSAARTSASESTVSRSVVGTAVVRIGSRSSRGLLEAAEEKLSKMQRVTGVSVEGVSNITPKKGKTIVTVDVELVVPGSVGLEELENTAGDVVAVESLRIDE